MSLQSSSRKPQTQRQKTDKMSRQLNSLKTELHGKKYTPPADPRMITLIPYNTATIRLATSTNTGTLLVADLKTAITTQLKLSGTTTGTAWTVPIEYRIRSVKAYTSDTNNNLDITLFDFTNGDNGTLITLQDRGTPAYPAKVGYTYPSRVSTNPIHGSNEEGRSLVKYASASSSTIFYFTTYWRALA